MFPGQLQNALLLPFQVDGSHTGHSLLHNSRALQGQLYLLPQRLNRRTPAAAKSHNHSPRNQPQRLPGHCRIFLHTNVDIAPAGPRRAALRHPAVRQRCAAFHLTGIQEPNLPALQQIHRHMPGRFPIRDYQAVFGGKHIHRKNPVHVRGRSDHRHSLAESCDQTGQLVGPAHVAG